MLSGKILSTLAFLTLPCASALGCSSTWTGGASATWDTATTTNWNPNCVPQTAGDTAIFQDAGTSHFTITLQNPQLPIGEMVFEATANTFTITSNGSSLVNGFLMNGGQGLITVDTSSNFPQIIDVPIQLSNGHTISPNASPSSQLQFTGGQVWTTMTATQYGILDTQSTSPSEVVFNSGFNLAGSILFTSVNQTVGYQIFGLTGISAGEVIFQNALNISTTKTGVILGPPGVPDPSSDRPMIQLSGGTLTTTNIATISGGGIGVSLPQNSGTSYQDVTITGGTWSNTNTNTIGTGIADTSISYGTNLYLGTVDISGGEFTTDNTGTIQSSGTALAQSAGCYLNIETLTLSGTALFNINQQSIFNNGVTISASPRYGVHSVIGTFNLNGGGSNLVENVGSLTHQVTSSFAPQGVFLNTGSVTLSVAGGIAGVLSVDNFNTASITGGTDTNFNTLAGVSIDLDSLSIDGAGTLLSLSNEGNITNQDPTMTFGYPNGPLGVQVVLGPTSLQNGATLSMSNTGAISSPLMTMASSGAPCSGVSMTISDLTSFDGSSLTMTNTGSTTGNGTSEFGNQEYANGVTFVIVDVFSPTNGSSVILENNQVGSNLGDQGGGGAYLQVGLAHTPDNVNIILDASSISLSNNQTVNNSATGSTLQFYGDFNLTNSSTLTMMNGEAMNAGTVGFAAIGSWVNGSGTNMSPIVNSNFNMTSSTVTMDNGWVVNGGLGTNISINGNITFTDSTVNLTNSGSISSLGEQSAGSAIIAGLGLTIAGSSYVHLVNTGTPSSAESNFFGSLLQVTPGQMPAAGITLSGGTLHNDDYVVADFITNTGGTLAGTGTYASLTNSFSFIEPPTTTCAVINSGSLIPGSPLPSGAPGTMTILGNFTQTSSGNFIVNLQDPTTFSLLQVQESDLTGDGIATLAGAITIEGGSGLTIGTPYSFTVLTAAQPLVGTFSTVVNNLPPGFSPKVSYSVDPSVIISISSEITSLFPTFPGGFLGMVGISANQLNQLTVSSRLQRVGVTCSTPPVYCEEKSRWLKPKKMNDCEYPEPKAWDVYIGPIATVGGEFHSKKDMIGFNYWELGLLAGIDYGKETWGVGFAASYEYMKAHVHRHWGNFHVNQIHASLYGKYAPSCLPNLAFNGIVGGSYDFYHFNRSVDFSSHDIDLTARAHPGGSEFDTLLGMEYTICVGDHGELIPELQAEYIYASVNKFSEHHAGLYDLKFHSQYAKSLTANLGLRGNYTWYWDDFAFTPEASVMWQREFSAKQYKIYFTSAEIAEPTASAVMPAAGRNILLTGIDLKGTWKETYSLEGRYSFEWNSLYHEHFLYLGFDYNF